jgi:hypothetical protein
MSFLRSEFDSGATHHRIDVIKISTFGIKRIKPVGDIELGAPFGDVLNKCKTKGLCFVAILVKVVP